MYSQRKKICTAKEKKYVQPEKKNMYSQRKKEKKEESSHICFSKINIKIKFVKNENFTNLIRHFVRYGDIRAKQHSSLPLSTLY